MPIDRRRLVALAATAGFLIPGRAFAMLPLPLKEPPPRVRPLGTWAFPLRKFQVVQDGSGAVTVTAPLQFRPAIDVEEPTLRWWRNATAAGQPRRTADPRGITIDPPRSQVLTPSMVSGMWVDTPIDLDVPPTTRKGGYRFSCEMYDPATRRRAEFSFLLTVLDRSPT